MRWFINLSTRAKLFFGFGLMLIFLIIVIIAAYRNITLIRESQRTMFEDDMAAVVNLLELRSDLNRNRALVLEMMVMTKRSDQETLERDIRGRAKGIDEELQKLFAYGRNDLKFLSRFEELKTTLNAYRQTREAQFALIYQGKVDEARQLGVGAQNDRFERVRAIAIELEKEAQERARQAVIQSEQKADQAVRLFVIIGLAALAMGIVMIVFLNRIISKPLSEISRVAERVAAGDLTANVSSTHRTDEIGALTQTFSRMVENLRGMTQEVGEGVNVLLSSASEILAVTTQIASGAAETATAVSQTTATVEEIRQTVQLAAQKARHVSESAQKVAQVSQGGKKSVDELIAEITRIREQMESIAESIVRLSEQSQTISEINAAVNDLAEQSNLLAVNAAIEAAKAGEQGKGFAVVAQEVRSLAEQSKQATSQVRVILSDNQRAMSTAVMVTEQGSKAVESGVTRSAQAGETIRTLTESVAESAQSATQIAASSQQQLIGMEQVAVAMESIKQASAQNVASSKQAETAAKDLHQLGQKLKQMVAQYKV